MEMVMRSGHLSEWASNAGINSEIHVPRGGRERHLSIGAGYGIRTRDFQLGKPFQINVTSRHQSTIHDVRCRLHSLITSLSITLKYPHF